jgi:hypothetical protein
MARQEARVQEARVKRVWAILLFFTQIGFIVFTYLFLFLAPLVVVAIMKINHFELFPRLYSNQLENIRELQHFASLPLTAKV